MEEKQKLDVRAVKSAKHPRTEDTPSKKQRWHFYISDRAREPTWKELREVVKKARSG